MQAVLSKIIFHLAPVTLVTLETPSDTVRKLQHYQFQQKSYGLVNLPLVEQMLFVMKEAEQPLVNAYLTILETHMLPADQSVLSTRTVHPTKHVNNFIALTHVLVLVESMQIAEFKIIFPCALAEKVILEILSQHAD